MSESSTEIAVDTALLARVQDALVPLQAEGSGDARGTAASAAALLRATREVLAHLEDPAAGAPDPRARGYRQLAHRILEAAGTRDVRLAFHATPFAGEWTDLLMRAVVAADWSTGDLFFSRARAHGDRTLFLLPRNRQEGRVSWAEAEGRVLEIGRALLGMQARDPSAGPVAMLGQNSPELALLDLACLVTGTPNVPVPANSPPDQIDFILRHSNASVLFLGDDELAEQARAFAPPPGVRSVHWLDGRREAGGPVRSLSDFLALGDDVPPESVRRAAAQVRCRDLATTMYTSGTTGIPKGVPFTHGNLVTKRFARAAAWPEIGAGDVFLCYLPLYHTFGRWLEMLGCVFWGSIYAFVEDASITSLLYSFQHVRPTTFISVPRKWIQIAESVAPVDDDEPRSAEEDAELAAALVRQTGGRLRRGLSAAGYLPPVVFRRFHAAGIELHSGFGMTEATGGITMTPVGDYQDDSIGMALPGIELKVAGDGELLIRGWYVTPPAEGEPPREDGWFATGDIVRTDAEGHLRIIDRKKEIFKNVQGETISPRRIENLFSEFDVVTRAIVIGDRRPFCTVLLVPSEDLRRDFPPAAGAATIDNHELRDLIAPAVEAVNRFLAPFERILDFALLSEDLDPAAELTAKGTPKRAVVTERLAEAIEAMYARDQVAVKVGDVEVRIPQWFLRYSGIPTREIRAEDGALVAAGRRLTVRRAADGSSVTVGDADYDPGGDAVLLGEIVGRAKLWLGNDAVRRFAGSGIDHWWRRGRRFPVRTRLVRRAAQADAADPPDSLPANPTVASLHTTVRALSHPDPAKRRAAALRLREALDTADRDLEHVVRELLLSSLGDAEVRTDALHGLIPTVAPKQLDEVLSRRILTDPDFLGEEEARSLGQVSLRGDQMDRLAARAAAWARAADVPDDALDRLLRYLVCVAVEHPTTHLRLRSLLAALTERAANPVRRAQVESQLQTLITTFRNRLPAPAPADGVTWEQIIEMRGVDGDEVAARIVRALSGTRLLPEAMALFGPHPADNLRPLERRSIRVTFLGKGLGRDVHLLEWSPDGLDEGSPQLECVLKVNTALEWDAVQREIRLLVRTRTGGSGRPLVKTHGGGYPDHQVWTEEFVPGRTLDRLVEELAGSSEEGTDRLIEMWPFLVSSCAALLVDFWRRTGRRISLAQPTAQKVVVPGHDWLLGGRLVSIADRIDCDRLTDVLTSIRNGIVKPLSERFAESQLDVAWPMLFSAALEVLTESEGCSRLESEAADLPEDDELSGAIRRFTSGIRRRGFLPERIRLAARRYRRWAQINADATVEAQAATLDQIEDAYGLRALDRERPGSRLQLFRHTVFRGASPDLTSGLDELIAATLAAPPARADLHRAVMRLRETVTSDEREEFFLARMLYPHVDPGTRAMLVREEDAAGEFDTGITVEHKDNAGELFRIRRPASPNEIAALARIFRGAGIRRAPQMGQDHLLIVLDAKERVLGGVISRGMSDTYMRLEWLALSRQRRGRGIGAVLVRELLERLRAQGVRVVSTGFFRPAFFRSLGFGVDRRYAGLVRFLTPDPDEVKPARDISDPET